jgi:hypothetical protein
VMMNLKIRTRKDNSRIRAVKELQFTQWTKLKLDIQIRRMLVAESQESLGSLNIRVVRIRKTSLIIKCIDNLSVNCYNSNIITLVFYANISTY